MEYLIIPIGGIIGIIVLGILIHYADKHSDNGYHHKSHHQQQHSNGYGYGKWGL